MTEPALRVALVGYGSAGRGIHAPLLERAGIRVAHVVTSDPDRTSAARTAHTGVRVHESFDALLEHRDDVDLVVLASPNPVHAAQAIAAIERGLPVVVDKPLAVSAQDARLVVAAAHAAGTPLTVFQNRRHDREHLTLRRLLRDRALGRVMRYEARFERWRPVPKTRWREQLLSHQGGGLLLDLQSHLVDGAIHLFGPVASVYAELDSVSTPADDVTFLSLRHVDGVRSHLGATSLAGAPGPHLRVLGEKAAYVVSGVDGEEQVTSSAFRDAASDRRGWLVSGDRREPVVAQAGGWSEFYPAVVEWLRDRGPAPVDPQDSLAVVEILDAARVSAESGDVVRLPTPEIV